MTIAALRAIQGSLHARSGVAIDKLQATSYTTDMDIVIQAERVMEDAEGRLRALIASGLERQLYGDVARVAKMAQAIAAARGAGGHTREPDHQEENFDDDREGPASVLRRNPKSTKAGPARNKRRTYPRFEREDGRLVKIGWSKKNASEYTHKAPLEVVEAFCNTLKEALGTGTSDSFVMEDLLPLATPNAEDIPDYQTYLSLAWLRSLNVVKKDGRHSYKLVDPQWLDEGFDEAWSSLPDLRNELI